jgi:hypothetical protein
MTARGRAVAGIARRTRIHDPATSRHDPHGPRSAVSVVANRSAESVRVRMEEPVSESGQPMRPLT